MAGHRSDMLLPIVLAGSVSVLNSSTLDSGASALSTALVEKIIGTSEESDDGHAHDHGGGDGQSEQPAA